MIDKKADVLVIGGGIIGCSGAFFLAKNGKEVILLERNTSVGLEASGVNAGSLPVQSKPFPMTHLALAAAELWQTFSREVGYELDYHRVGGLRVAETEEDLTKLRDIAKNQRRYGLFVEEISGENARKIAPYLGESIRGANYCELDGYADPLKVVRLVARAAIDWGVKIMTEISVLEISPKLRSGYLVKTTKGVFEAGQVLIAAGVWSRQITKSLGVDLPISLRINQMMVTDQSPPLLHHLITHANGNLTLKQLPVGTIMVGGGWQGKGDLITNTKEPTYESMIGNADMAIRVVPALRKILVIRSWAAFDGRTADKIPIIGDVSGNPGAYLATACFGGFQIGPLVGRLIAEKICTGASSIPIDEFNVSRYDQEKK